jgi:hypothetical protein
MWVLVPRCKKISINGGHYQICADDDGFCNRKSNPTIFVNTLLDLLANLAISKEETIHLLLNAFAIAIHELGHLIHRFVCSTLNTVIISHGIYHLLHKSITPPQRIHPRRCMLPYFQVVLLGGVNMVNAL